MCSSKKLTVNESLGTSSQVCNNFDEDPSQTGLAESAKKADMPVPSDMTRRAKKAAKKVRQRVAKYGIEKLPPVPSTLEKQETFMKDPTGSVAMQTTPQSIEYTVQDIKATKANIDSKPA
jgi:hypothetical protein